MGRANARRVRHPTGRLEHHGHPKDITGQIQGLRPAQADIPGGAAGGGVLHGWAKTVEGANVTFSRCPLAIPGMCRDVKVLDVTPHGPHGAEHGFFTMRLENPGIAQAVAGQFLMVRAAAFGVNPVWPRPFSISRLTPDAITLFIQACGRGTDILAGLGAGDTVTIWGPLGQGFAMEPESRTLMLAGGVGLAPFVEYTASHPVPANLALLFGHRAPLDCYPYAAMADRIRTTTFLERTPADREVFIGLLDEQVAAYADGLIVACGPRPFLVTVARLARKYSARAQVSLENRMACGVGGCLGCVEKNALGGYVQTCTQGPVFWVEELQLTGDA